MGLLFLNLCEVDNLQLLQELYLNKNKFVFESYWILNKYYLLLILHF